MFSDNKGTPYFQSVICFRFKIFSTGNFKVKFILVINQLDAQNLLYNKFISCLYMFRAPCAHRQEVRITPICVMIPEAV